MNINNDNSEFYKNKYFKYKKKYLKYKNKYLKVGGANGLNMDGIFEKLIVIRNGGRLSEGGTEFRNQCMFISILDYLKRNGYPYLTLSELREQADITGYRQTQEWDQDIVRHVDAIRTLSVLYDLDINVWNVDYRGLLDRRFLNADGLVLIPRYRDGDGRSNVINIASYGAHFELIIGGGIFITTGDHLDGVHYEPYVLNNDKTSFVKLSTLLKNEQKIAELNNELDVLMRYKDEIVEVTIFGLLNSEPVDTFDDTVYKQFLEKAEVRANKIAKPYEDQIQLIKNTITLLNRLTENKRLRASHIVIINQVEAQVTENYLSEYGLEGNFEENMQKLIKIRKKDTQIEIDRLKKEIIKLEKSVKLNLDNLEKFNPDKKKKKVKRTKKKKVKRTKKRE